MLLHKINIILIINNALCNIINVILNQTNNQCRILNLMQNQINAIMINKIRKCGGIKKDLNKKPNRFSKPVWFKLLYKTNIV